MNGQTKAGELQIIRRVFTMENAMECVDSTIAPSAIPAVAMDVYDGSVPATCELLQHNLDATYLVMDVPDRELAGVDLLVLLRQAYLLGHDARRTRIESLGTRWRGVRRTQKMDALRSPAPSRSSRIGAAAADCYALFTL